MADTITPEERSLIDAAVAARPAPEFPDDPRINKLEVAAYLSSPRASLDRVELAAVLRAALTADSIASVADDCSISRQGARIVLKRVAPAIHADLAARGKETRDRKNKFEQRVPIPAPLPPAPIKNAVPSLRETPTLWAWRKRPDLILNLAFCRGMRPVPEPRTEQEARLAIGLLSRLGDAAADWLLKQARGRKVKA